LIIKPFYMSRNEYKCIEMHQFNDNSTTIFWLGVQ
jgi:hypothetical protein